MSKPFRIYLPPSRHGTTGRGLPSPPGRLHASHEGTSASRHASLDPRPFSAIRAGLIGAEKPAAAASGPYARGCGEGAACGCAGRRPKATGHVDSLGCRRSTSPSAFGSCGEGSWYLIVKGGGGPRAFRLCVKTFVTWNQAYFMSLFFFVSACAEIKFRAPHAIDAVVSTQISAYFVPSSYAKGWPTFQANKRRRLLVPALAVLLVVSPLTTLVAGNLVYAPSPGVGWYLWWLLLFNVVYVSFQPAPPVDEALAEALTGADAPTAARGPPPPLLLSTVFRVGAGIGICGFALLPFLVLTKGSFASMPVSLGSVTCDFLMFYLGLRAKAGGWLERPLTEQLDVHPLVLLTFVVVEAAGMAVASLDVDKFGLVLVLLAGMFCLDMSLLTLLVFQRWGNVETRATRFLARGAFGVYLLHPLVVTAATRVYLKLAGDGVNYPVGFGVVAVVSLLVVWPLAYSLAQLPGLRAVL